MFLRTNEKMKRYNYLPQIMKIKCTINKQEFLIGLIIEAAAISGISAIFLPSATILSAQIEMCLPRFSFSPMRNVIFYIQVGHRMLKAGPFPLGRLRSIIVTIILFSCCLTHYTYHTPLIIDNFHSKHQHQYSS
jgi:hypothetical protein